MKTEWYRLSSSLPSVWIWSRYNAWRGEEIGRVNIYNYIQEICKIQIFIFIFGSYNINFKTYLIGIQQHLIDLDLQFSYAESWNSNQLNSIISDRFFISWTIKALTVQQKTWNKKVDLTGEVCTMIGFSELYVQLQVRGNTTIQPWQHRVKMQLNNYSLHPNFMCWHLTGHGV